MHGSIVGGRVLVPGEGLVEAALSWSDGCVDAVGDVRTERGGSAVDARGCLVLPGLVDLHGDAFERCLMPRPGVRFDVALALEENDAALVGAGITTSFLSATDSWEPGLRSRATLRELVAACGSAARAVDVRLHVRHEICHTDAFEELLAWLDDGTVTFLSLNDHTPGEQPDHLVLRPKPALQDRTGLDEQELRRQLAEASGRRPVGHEQAARLAERAHRHGVPLASHDAGTEADLERDRALGIAVAEFPTSIDLARRYRDAGIAVLLGAPNLVRGGSHLSGLAVEDAVRAGAVDALCSDYHYPSLLQAPFLAAEHRACPFADGWALVSSAPARCAGLGDRGELRVGQRADVIVVKPPDERRPAHLRAVVSSGRVVLRGPA